MVVAKTLFASVRFGTSLGVSLVTDPRRFAGTVSDEVTALVQRAVAALSPSNLSLPALPGRGRHELEAPEAKR